jgi:methylated-DNA-[protein]-cysteine S-methyltransferase
MLLCHTTFSTPLGPVIIAASEQGLAGIWFSGQKHAPDTRDWVRRDDHPLLLQAAAQVQAYLRGDATAFEAPQTSQTSKMPLMTVGTDFQRQVWRQVSRIGRGQVRTYADIARALGRPQAARAVGAAVGRNPWLMLVPCHRVVGQGGQLTGYAAGLERKQQLLRMEGALH